MANEQNLIPFNELTESEQREIRRKGGIASGEARRRKRGIREALKMMAELDHPDNDLKAELEDLGVETTNEVALAFSVFMSAIKRGDYRAMESIMSAIGEHTDKEEAQIKKLRADTEKVKAEIQLATQTDEDAAEPVTNFMETLGKVETGDIYDDPATE